jgi:hypothetical protein
MKFLYRIDTGYACAGVIIDSDGILPSIVVKTAPIFDWMVGRRWSEVLTWGNIKEVLFVEVF